MGSNFRRLLMVAGVCAAVGGCRPMDPEEVGAKTERAILEATARMLSPEEQKVSDALISDPVGGPAQAVLKAHFPLEWKMFLEDVVEAGGLQGDPGAATASLQAGLAPFSPGIIFAPTEDMQRLLDARVALFAALRATDVPRCAQYVNTLSLQPAATVPRPVFEAFFRQREAYYLALASGVRIGLNPSSAKLPDTTQADQRIAEEVFRDEGVPLDPVKTAPEDLCAWQQKKLRAIQHMPKDVGARVLAQDLLASWPDKNVPPAGL